MTFPVNVFEWELEIYAQFLYVDNLLGLSMVVRRHLKKSHTFIICAMFVVHGG